MLRLLVAGTVDPSVRTHGIAICLGQTLRAIRHWSLAEVSCALLLDEPTAELVRGRDDPELRAEVVHVRGRGADPDVSLRGLAGGPLASAERGYLETVATMSRDVDAILWFAPAWDPLTLQLPRHSACPVVYHVNDSIALFQALRPGGMVRRLKRALAERQERRVLQAGFASVLYVSTRDAGHVTSRGLADGGSRIAALPIGVEIERFVPATAGSDASQPSPAGQPLESRPLTILLSGVMNFLPNVRAACALVDDVLPRVTADVRVRLVGKSPSDEVLALAVRDPRITVTGMVEDIVAEYQRADVLVAPIDIATGSKNKVLEALACGIPAVTTSAVLETFGQMPGAIAADTPAEFAAVIHRLAADPAARRTLGEAGRAHVVEHYSWQGRTRTLLQMVAAQLPERAVARPGAA